MQDRGYDGAVVQFLAVAAGIEAFLVDAFADFAMVAAEGEFYSVGPATHAINGVCRDFGYVVHFAPFPGGFFSQFVVVFDGGYAGIAGFAIQATASDQLFHLFLFYGFQCFGYIFCDHLYF